jgi:small subunit ribosomal protein S2
MTEEKTTVDKKENDGLIEAMFSAGAHYGYSKSRRHPSVQPFIYGVKNKVEIFDLEKTSKSLEKAVSFVESLGQANQQILFISGKKESEDVIKTIAQSLNLPYVAGRWIGGALTNFSEINKRIKKFLDLAEKKEKGELTKYTKKERLLIDRDIEDLHSKFGGLVVMKELPKALFVVDPRQEHTAVTEAKRMNIPVVALSGSDCDLKMVDYAIPGNDSSRSSIEFFVSKIRDAYSKGKSEARNPKSETNLKS